MAEILTESFCERCGTRYTFESPARRTNPLGALGTVSRGIRNFVVSPDQTIDEAFAVARLENEQKATAHQLEAFHQTFNFCLSCRQYTCSNCWNGVEGRCQSCAPMPEAEALPADDTAPDSPVIAEAMAIARAAALPVMEVPAEFQTPTAEPVLDEPASEVAEQPEGVVAEPVPAVMEPEPPVAEPVQAEPEAAVAEPEADAEDEALTNGTPGLPALPPGVSLDDEIAAYEMRVAALSTPASTPGPEPEPEPQREPEPEPVEPLPSAVASTPPDAPLSWPVRDTLRPAGSAAHEHEAEAPKPRVVAYAPELPAVSAVVLPAAQTTGSCPACGLALSATARFCRRCGTAQQQVGA